MLSQTGSGLFAEEIARRGNSTQRSLWVALWGSEMRSLDIQLGISKLEKQQALYEARGMLSPSNS
ncbi:hypothetical protein FF021_17515 [Leptospira noguchii]|uniref:hypothetical protein n=1 Tax=Leptospira noguchii TaxID=28182 RepID=UPI0011461B76|nr:hypothetical protein [Leptospira noguchii]TQE67535.1 hypothetical protein FF021_17515 [Leptospira noguchii]UOG52061.1 hypothetical protein MAL09_15725 [Leptospira noguchii]